MQNKLSKILLCLSTILLFETCDQKITENRFTRKQIIESTENEKTVIFNNDYLELIKFNESNLRFRFLPYIESKNEKINTSDFMNSYNFLLSYDQNLFNIIHKHNFKVVPYMDQYHKVELDLRYNISTTFEEKFFPTLVFMIQHGNVWPGLTSFKGVGLKILIRLSVFDNAGNEIAFCQKKVFNSIFSNDFFQDHVIFDNSSFISDLNNENNNNSPVFSKISECKRELNFKY